MLLLHRTFSGRSLHVLACMLLGIGLFWQPRAWSANTTLVPAGATWRYLDNGTNQGTGWRTNAFNDGTWSSGAAQLGYGDGDEATIVSYGPDPNNKYITTYFRHSFSVANPAAYTSLTLRLLRDDGAVVYLNGSEIFRSNMPSGATSYTTFAPVALSATDESTFLQTTISPSLLVAGTNLLAVEIHQANLTSTDISFDLELTGTVSASVTRGPYLQRGSPTGVTVRWRTDVQNDSRVRYGTDPANLNLAADNATLTTEHEVALNSLLPNTQYYYSVGTTTNTLSGGADFTFFTAPSPGASQPIRIWVLGDSGTADSNAQAVRNAYTTFTGNQYTDLWLMLGDNAYQNGTDSEYQAAVFNMYPTFLRQTVLWPTLGNHDTAQSTNPPSSLPYYQMFTLPMNGEAGGVASGTEDYYSFDYGNIHLICLDSMTSDRSPAGPMMTWLQADISSTTKNWIIAFWHHPPYSKGSHDSDTEQQLIEMRQNALPILENYGVDLVLTGHSHSYERSFLLDGHYGSSGTLTGGMIKDSGSGREDGTGAYDKPVGGTAPHQGAVYAVAGSSGQASGGALNHPAMFISLNNLGSMVLDVNGNRLDAKFLRETGAVGDYFTILKGGGTPNNPPSVSITGPANGATFTAPAQIAITADASDTDGSIANVEFFQGSTKLGEDATSPYEFSWSNVAAGSYTLTAKATDNLGASTTSGSVSITVDPSPSAPAAPTNLRASVGKKKVNLTWSQSSSPNIIQNKVYRSNTSGGPYSLSATLNAAASYTDTTVASRTTYYYVVTAVNNSSLESANSNQVAAKPK